MCANSLGGGDFCPAWLAGWPAAVPKTSLQSAGGYVIYKQEERVVRVCVCGYVWVYRLLAFLLPFLLFPELRSVLQTLN